MKLQLLAAAAVLAVPGTAIAAHNMATMSATQYVKKAGASDLFEKESAQIELSSTRNAGLRQFANMMIRDHTKSTDEVKRAAMRAGMHPMPPMLSPAQRTMIAELRRARGTARDGLYVRQQKMAHEEALMLHRNYAQSGSVGSLKMTANTIVPVVRGHLDKISTMQM